MHKHERLPEQAAEDVAKSRVDLSAAASVGAAFYLFSRQPQQLCRSSCAIGA